MNKYTLQLTAAQLDLLTTAIETAMLDAEANLEFEPTCHARAKLAALANLLVIAEDAAGVPA